MRDQCRRGMLCARARSCRRRRGRWWSVFSSASCGGILVHGIHAVGIVLSGRAGGLPVAPAAPYSEPAQHTRGSVRRTRANMLGSLESKGAGGRKQSSTEGKLSLGNGDVV